MQTMNLSAAPTGIGSRGREIVSPPRPNMGCAIARRCAWRGFATKNLKKSSSTKPKKRRGRVRSARRESVVSAMITRCAAECVEELLNATRHATGTPWFVIIERKMQKLIRDYDLQCKDGKN